MAVEIDFDEVEQTTDGAWLVRIDLQKVWLPRSICEVDEYMNVATVPTWLARKEGLI